MRRICMLMAAVAFLALAVAETHAAKIVVLTEEPVAKFVLPDGSVLKNAYAWRRTSEGLMIIHDDGQYFMNFKTLPPEWQAAYLGEEVVAAAEEKKVEESKKAEVEEPAGDRYRVGSVLEKVPSLNAATREKLLERGAGEELDQGVLVIALLQAVLDEERNEASRCILFLEEKGYEIEEAAREKLFDSCPYCGGDGTVIRKCQACEGSGECSACKDPATALGKRSTRDQQSRSALGKEGTKDKKSKTESDKDGSKKTDCEQCEGTGKCAKCGGDGKAEVRCGKCRGTGKNAARIYCEVVRDKWVRQMSALVSGEPPTSIMASPSVDIGKILALMPGIHSNAPGYYASPDYDGQMDTNIVVACLMHALVEKNLSAAKRFKVMLETEYPENEVLVIEDYLKLCETCDSKGWCDQDCPTCKGSGECPKCKGEGDSLGLKNWSVECSDCKGTGECSACEGSGKIGDTCRTCSGLGRVFERSRCQIRREMMVDELNGYYRKKRAETL